MSFAEQVEIIADNSDGIAHRLAVFHAPQLQQQAVAQVNRTHAGRVHGADYIGNGAYMSCTCFDSGGYAYVVGNRGERTSKVAVVVDIAYYVSGNLAVRVADVEVAQLVLEHVDYGVQVVDRQRLQIVVVGTAVSGVVAVVWHIVVVAVVGALQFFGSFAEVFCIVRPGVGAFAFFERRVFVKGTTHLVLELRGCHLEEASENHLLRSQALTQTDVLL